MEWMYVATRCGESRGSLGLNWTAEAFILRRTETKDFAVRFDAGRGLVQSKQASKQASTYVS